MWRSRLWLTSMSFKIVLPRNLTKHIFNDVVKMVNVSDHRPDSLATITDLDDIGSLYGNVAIETLSDNVLLDISDFCLDKTTEIDPWYAGHHEVSVLIMACECPCARDSDTLCLQSLRRLVLRHL